MGLKLKWFRRRITFEGIPSAPERSIRRKEQNSDITTIGVYRKSVNFEDYIEPSRASYWEPPSQPIASTTIRKPNTSTNTSATVNNSSASLARHSADDKIASREHNNGGTIETPPEPSYSPPQPPNRRGLSKAKSTPNVLTLDSVETDLNSSQSIEATRSVEVLAEVTVENRERPVIPAPRYASINYISEDVKEQVNEDEKWKQQQPEFFNEILEKVNVLASTTKPITNEYGENSDTELPDDVFEKVKPKPRLLKEKDFLTPEINGSDSSLREFSRNHSSSSIEDIFEPRPPECQCSEEQIEHTNLQYSTEGSHKPAESQENSEMIYTHNVTPPPLKSILKKRAPPPPQQSAQSSVSPIEVPTPPPRGLRKQSSPLAENIDNDDDDENEEDDDYLNWNMVERHRSSITHTVATQKVDPEIMRNVPSSLQQTSATNTKQLLNRRALLDDDTPKTLRGMRNNRAKTDDKTLLGRQGRGARESESNLSEASA